MHPVTLDSNRDVTGDDDVGKSNDEMTEVNNMGESNDVPRTNDLGDDDVVTNSNDVANFDSLLTNGKRQENSDDDMSLSSSSSEKDMGAVEERAASSLSTSSVRGSKIPRLTRSLSLRERPQKLHLDQCAPRLSVNNAARYNQKTVPPFGLYRSSSFATARGMNDISPGSFERMSTPATPELRRKFPSYSTNYVSPYSKKAITAERKGQNPHSRLEKDPHMYYSPQVPRRTSLPQMMCSYYSPNTSSDMNGKVDVSPDEDEDNTSEKSFGSVCSAHSCDLGSGPRRSASGAWNMDRRPRNILHCSHAHDHEPDDYLTPTQRAARKIRELQAELKKARREIAEKDNRISSLTRELVELRLTKAEVLENADAADTHRGNTEESGKDKTKVCSSRKHSPLVDFLPPCFTPTSDDELKLLSREKKSKRLRAHSKPDSQNSAVSSRTSPATASIGGDSDSGDLSRSIADSGHYDDFSSPCLSSRDSMDAGIPSLRKIISSLCACEGERDTVMVWASVCAAEEGIKAEWSRRLEELKSNHMEEYHELKERHNDKVEMLLSKLSDANLKYFELRPQYDKAQEKMRHLEKEVTKLKDELRESEIRQQKVYLQMYLKGQQSVRLEEDEKLSKRGGSHHSKDGRKSASKESAELEGSTQSMVFSLMKQLAQSENEIEKLKVSRCQESSRSGRRTIYGGRREEIDPEITLQFLKSAIYYFLTDKENAQGHLRAIESILGYSSVERGTINKYFRI